MEGFGLRVVAGVEDVVIYVTGEIDMASAPDLSAVLDEAIATDASLVRVDFDRVSFMDSTGLKVLIEAFNALDSAGRVLVISRARPAQRRVIDLTGVDRVFRLVDADITPDLAAHVTVQHDH